MSKGTELKDAYYNLCNHLRLLRQLMEEDCVDGQVYTFPPLSKDDIGKKPDSINLERVTGKQAIAKSLLHLTDFTTKHDTPGVFGLRLAGVVQVQSVHGDEIAQRIKVINALKDEFKALILSLHPNVDARFQIFRDHLPGVSKKALTRHILLAPEHTRNINFAWTHRYSGRRFKREDILKMLDRAAKQTPVRVDPASWHIQLEIERNAVAAIRHTSEFIQRRPLRVSPVANLAVYPEHSKPKRLSLIAHSPVFVVNQQPEISHLPNFHGGNSALNVDGLVLVIERKHIYCKQP